MSDRDETGPGISERDEAGDSGTSESPDGETVSESPNEPTASESTASQPTTSNPTASQPTTSDLEPMASDTASDADDEQRLRNNVERYVRYLLVAGLSLLALIAMVRFYFAASATIDTWISREYRSLFQALFNLALLLLAGAGIAWQARKLR